MKYCQLLVTLASIYFSFVLSCTVDNKKQYHCNSVNYYLGYGKEEWTKVEFNSTDPLNLTKNFFKNTPNLEQITLRPLGSIEKGAFDGLEKLNKLKIFGSIEEIPKGIIDVPSIRSLQISSEIKKVSEGFFDQLPKIEEVFITYNYLKQIGAGIFNNTPLKELHLNHNELKTIQNGAFFNMNSLKILSLRSNQLKTFEAVSLLGETSGVQRLFLSKNNFTKITKSMFTNLAHLQELYLEINQIEEIEDESFQSLPELYYLDISNNRLKELQPEIFPKAGSKLYILFVHNNRMTFLDKEIFSQNTIIKYLSYGGNPLQCSCLEEIKDLTIENNITRICDDVYFSGQRPACVAFDIANSKCVYDVELTKNLFETYKNGSEDYENLGLQCDISEGPTKVKLINNEY